MIKNFLANFVMYMIVHHSLNSVQSDLPEDANLNFMELTRKYGYKAQEHDVVTEDGYILKMFHIPGDKNRTVLLTHGVLDTSDTFIIRGRRSLAATLADRGYDLWLLNNRGNTYSRRHLRLDPDKDKTFWDFSFHEMGIHDLPAAIDYALCENKVDSLSLIGHSQGNQQFYVLGSVRPEYNDKVNVAIALGPVAFLNFDNLEFPVTTLVEMGPLINEWLVATNQEEVFGDASLLRHVRESVCARKVLGYEICAKGIFSSLGGEDLEELEEDFFYNIIGHYPTHTSRRNLLHLLQVASRQNFAQFDHGEQNNLALYQSRSPPPYDLSKVRMKMALLVGANDKIANVKNTGLLRDKLANVISYRVMEHKKFNHIDHVWGRHMYKYLFPRILKLLSKYGH